MTTFLDLPGEIRNYIYSIRGAHSQKFFAVGEYGMRYQMLMPLMMVDTQIAKEVKTITLAETGLCLHPTKAYTGIGTTEWRFRYLPPSRLRPLFRRLKVSLYEPVHLFTYQRASREWYRKGKQYQILVHGRLASTLALHEEAWIRQCRRACSRSGILCWQRG